MENEIKVVKNNHSKDFNKTVLQKYSPEIANSIREYHKTIPGYEQTPLVSLKGLSKELGLIGLYVKDESKRFNLNAFKALGGSYAIAKELSNRFKIDKLDFSEFLKPDVNEKVRQIHFMTATDGNHGRGIAWFANKLGGRAQVFMPKGSSNERLNNIKAEGADAKITELNYDETVEYVNELASNDPNAAVFQDTAFSGYETIPEWIMQGYTTLSLECTEQLKGIIPTHIFLQAGVGAFAGSATAFFRNIYGKSPIITIVEPNAADCIYKSVNAKDGKAHIVAGEMNSIMAGLCCGVPCSLAWDIIKEEADFCISCPDSVAECGMRILAHPKGEDSSVISGESGAVTTGLVYELMTNPKLKDKKQQLGLDSSSVVLCISTEGNTDKERYETIINGGSIRL